MLVRGARSTSQAVKRETESEHNFQWKVARAPVRAGQAERIAAGCAAASVPCTSNDAASSSLPVRHAELGGTKPRSHLHSGVRLQVREAPPGRRAVFAGGGVVVETKQGLPALPWRLPGV